MHHSAEYVNTLKRAITLFINIKKVPIPVDLTPTIKNSDMTAEMEAAAMEIGKRAI